MLICLCEDDENVKIGRFENIKLTSVTMVLRNGEAMGPSDNNNNCPSQINQLTH